MAAFSLADVPADAAVDMHTHVVPKSLARFAERGADWPRLILDSPHGGCFCCGQGPSRKLDVRSWDPARRLDDMAAEGVAAQLLSPMPMTYAYEFDAAAHAEFWEAHNDGTAEMAAAGEGRFKGLAGVPLQDVERAIAELRRAMGQLGLAGVEIGTHVCGTDLADARFDAFWQACDELGAIVFMHPDSTAGGRVEGPLLPPVGYPVETGIAAAKLLMAGWQDRFPRVKLVLAHGGGTLPWMLPRMDAAWSRFEPLRRTAPEAPSAAARRFTYDSLTFDTDNLAFLVNRLGADRITVGSDYPFPLAESPAGQTLRHLTDLTPEARTAMLSGNALRLLGVPGGP